MVDSVKENLHSFYEREKDHYDLAAVKKLLTFWDLVRVRLKSRDKGPSKFQSEWPSPHEVVSVKGVVVTLKEFSSNQKYVVHKDRFSNPLLSSRFFEPRA